MIKEQNFDTCSHLIDDICFLAPVYTKHQHQRCDHSAMTLAILFSLKSPETLENGLQTHSAASLQSYRSIDADTWYKWALMLLANPLLFEFFRNYTKLAHLTDLAYLCASLSYIFLYLS